MGVDQSPLKLRLSHPQAVSGVVGYSQTLVSELNEIRVTSIQEARVIRTKRTRVIR